MVFQSMSRQNGWVRVIALAVSVFFFTTQLGFAATPLPLTSSLKIEPASEPLISIKADFIAIPKELGEVLRAHEGSGRGLIVHIQDAHSNYEAQKHIGEILKYLSETQSLKLVNVEGATGRLYTSLFSSYPDPKVRQAVGEYLLREDQFTGPEWMAVTAKPNLILNGIEDNNLYESNRRVFLDALSFKHDDELILKAIDDLLQTAAAYLLPESSRAFFKQKRKFRDNQVGLPEYLNYLTRIAEEQKIGMSEFVSIRNFLKLVALQNRINYEAAEQEMAVLVGELKQGVDEKSFEKLQGHYLNFKLGRMSREEFYGIFSGTIAPEKVNRKRFGNVFRYFRYIRLYRHVNVGIFDEIEVLENRISGRILTDSDQIRLGRLFDYLEIYEKIFRFSLTQKEADFFFGNREQFKASAFREYLEPLRKQFHIETALPSDLGRLDADLARIERFYTLALERDAVLIENAVKAMKAKGETVCALITGGFHTPGIESYLRSKDFSYLVIQPRIKEKLDVEKDNERYEKSLQEMPSELERFLKQAYFSPQSSKLNDPRYQLAARAHVPDDVRMTQVEGEMAQAAAAGNLDLSAIPSLDSVFQKASLLAIKDARLNRQIRVPGEQDLPAEDKLRAGKVLRILYGPFENPFVGQSPSGATLVITGPLASGKVITAVAEPSGNKTSELVASLGTRQEIQLGNNDRVTVAFMERWAAELVKKRFTGRLDEQNPALAMAASLGGIQTKTLVNRLLKDLQHEFDLAKGSAVMTDKQVLASKRIRSFRDRLNRARSKVETLAVNLTMSRKGRTVDEGESVIAAYDGAEKIFRALQVLNDFNKEADYLRERKEMIEQLMHALRQESMAGLSKKEFERKIQPIRYRINSLTERSNNRLNLLLERSSKIDLEIDGQAFPAMIQKLIDDFENRQAAGFALSAPGESGWVRLLGDEAKTLIAEKRREWKLSAAPLEIKAEPPAEEVLPPAAVDVEPVAAVPDSKPAPTEIPYGDVFSQWYEEGGVMDALMGFGAAMPEEEHPLLNDETEEAIAVLARVPEVQQTSARRNSERLSSSWLTEDTLKKGKWQGLDSKYVIPLLDPNKPSAPAEPEVVETEVLPPVPAPAIRESPFRRFWNNVLWVLGILFYPLVLLDRAGTAVFDWFDKILTVKTGKRQIGLAEPLESRYAKDVGGRAAIVETFQAAEMETVRYQETVLDFQVSHDMIAAATQNANAGFSSPFRPNDATAADAFPGIWSAVDLSENPLSQPAASVEMPDGLQAAEGLITGNVEFPSLQFEAGGAAQPDTEIGEGLPDFQGKIVSGGGLEQLRQTLRQGNEQVGSFAIVMLTHVYDGDGDGDVDIFLGRSKFDDFDGRVQQAYNFLNTTSTQSQAYSSLITGIGLEGTPLGQIRQAMLTQGFHTIDFSFFHLGRLYDATGDGEVDVNFNADAVTTVTLGDKNFEFQTPAHVTEGLLYLQRPEAAPIGDLLSGHLQDGTAAQAIHTSLTEDPFGGRFAGIATQVLIHGRIGNDGAFSYTMDTNGDGVADSRDTVYSIVAAREYGRTITALNDPANHDVQSIGFFFAGRTVTGTAQADAFNLLLNDTTNGRDPGVFFGMVGGLGDADGDAVPDRLNDRNRDGVVNEEDLLQTAISGHDLAFTLNAFGDPDNAAAQQIGHFAVGVVPADTSLARLRSAMASDPTGRIAGFIETFLQNIFDYDSDGQTDFVIDGNQNGTVSREESETPLFRSGSLYAQALSFFEQNSAPAQILERFISGGYAPDTPLSRIYNAIINDTTGGKQTGFIGSVLFRSFFDYQNADGVVDFVADFNENGNPDDDTVILSQKMDRLGQALSFLEQSNPDSDIFATFFAGDQIEGHQPLVRGGGLDILRNAILTDTPDADVGGRIFYFLTRSRVVLKDGVETIEYDASADQVLNRPLPELAHILRVLNQRGNIENFAAGIVGSKDPNGEIIVKIPSEFVKPGSRNGGGGGVLLGGGSGIGGGGGGGGGGGIGGGGGGGGGGSSSGGSATAPSGSIHFSDETRLALTDKPEGPAVEAEENVVREYSVEVTVNDRGEYEFHELFDDEALAEGITFSFKYQILDRDNAYYFRVTLDGDLDQKLEVELYRVGENEVFPLKLGDPDRGEFRYQGRGDSVAVFFYNHDNPADSRIVIFNRKTKEIRSVRWNSETQKLRFTDDQGHYVLEEIEQGEQMPEAERPAVEPEKKEEGKTAEIPSPAPPAPEEKEAALEAALRQIAAEARPSSRDLRQVADEIARVITQNAVPQPEDDAFWADLADGTLWGVDLSKAAIGVAVLGAGAVVGHQALKSREKKEEETEGQSLGAALDRVKNAFKWMTGPSRQVSVEERRGFFRTTLKLAAGAALAASPLGRMVAVAQDAAAAARGGLARFVNLFRDKEREFRRVVDSGRFTRELSGELDRMRETDLKYRIEHTSGTAKLRYTDRIQRVFGKTLNQRLDLAENMTAADWEVKFLRPLMTVLDINHQDRFVDHFLASIEKTLPALLSLQQRGLIQIDSDIPSIWKSWTGMLKVDEWAQVNNEWAKTEFGRPGKSIKPKFELDTLLGMSLFLALLNYHDQWPGAEMNVPVDKRDQFFFRGVQVSLSREPLDLDAFRLLNDFDRFVTESYTSAFYSEMWDKLGTDRRSQFPIDVGKAIQEHRSLQLARMIESAYPHLTLRGDETHLLNQLDLARPMLTAILGQRGLWGGEVRSVSQIMEPAVFMPVIEMLKEFNRMPDMDQFYKGHDDPFLSQVARDWRNKKFTIKWEGTKVVFSPYRLNTVTLRDFDFSRTPPGFERMMRYLIPRRDTAKDSITLRLYNDLIRDEILKTAVGLEVGRKLFWIRYGLETGLIRVTRDGRTGRASINSARFFDKIANMTKLLPYVKDFFGLTTFNANNPDHIGKLSAMESAMTRMRLTPQKWSFSIFMSTQPEIRKQVLEILHAVTGNDIFLNRDFDFSNPDTGPDQVGAIMGWVITRLKEGWEETENKGRNLTAILRDNTPVGPKKLTRKQILIDLANRKKEAYNRLFRLQVKPITEDTLLKDLSLVGDVLAMATGALNADAAANDDSWNAWVVTQERVIEKLQQFRKEQEKLGAVEKTSLIGKIKALAQENQDQLLDQLVAQHEPPEQEAVAAASLGQALDALKLYAIAGPGVRELYRSPDKKRLFVAYADGSGKIFDIETGKDLQISFGTAVGKVEFSPDSKMLVVKHNDRAATATVFHLEAKTGFPFSLGEGIFFMIPVSFTADSRHLTIKTMNYEDKVFDLETQQNMEPLIGPHITGTNFIRDGKTLFVWDRRDTAKMFNLETKEEIPIPQARDVSNVRVSPDGRRLLVSYKRDPAKVFDPETLNEIPISLGRRAVKTQFSPDGRRLLVRYKRNTIQIIDLMDPSKRPVSLGRRAAETQFSPDGRRLLVRYKRNTIQIIDLMDPSKRPVSLGRRAAKTQFSPDGKRLFVKYLDHSAKIFDLETGKELPISLGSNPDSIYFSLDSRILFVRYEIPGRKLKFFSKIFDLNTPRDLAPLIGDRVDFTELSPDGRILVVKYLDHKAKIFDLETGAEFPISLRDDLEKGFFSQDGRILCVRYRDQTTEVFDLKTKQNLTSLLGPQVIPAYFFVTDSNKLIINPGDHTAKILDLEALEQVPFFRNLKEHFGENAYVALELLGTLIQNKVISSEVALEREYDFLRPPIERFVRATTQYNRAQIISLFKTSGILNYLQAQGADYQNHLDFYIRLIQENKRLALKILRDLFEAIKEGLVDAGLSEDEKEKILEFVRMTRGFNRVFYKVYKLEGRQKLLEILAFADKILDDEAGPDEMEAFKQNLILQGFTPDEAVQVLLTVNQKAIPTSGASFITSDKAQAVWQQYLDAGDRRGDVPQALQQLGRFGGGVFRGVGRRLKVGQGYDPEGKVNHILSSLRYPDTGKDEGQKAKDTAADKTQFTEALQVYVENMDNGEKRQEALRALFRYSSHHDLVREKVRNIQGGDYLSLDLLEQLFSDNENPLNILTREILNQEYKLDGFRPITNERRFLRDLHNLWHGQAALEERKTRLSKILTDYKADEIKAKLLGAESIDLGLKAAIEEIISNRLPVSAGELISSLFADSLRTLKQEKDKFEEYDTDTIQLKFRVVKGPGQGLYGLLGGVCIGQDLALWNKPNFYLLEMIDEAKGEAVGYVHLFEQEIDGMRHLTVPGIEPSTEFLARIKAQELYPLIEEALKAVALAGGFSQIDLPTSKDILSNRMDIYNLAARKGYPEDTLPVVIQWNTHPRPYPFSKVYVMWNRIEAAAPVMAASLGAAVGQVQQIGQKNRLNEELERLDRDAAKFGVQLDNVLANALFGVTAAERVNSVQLFDFSEGLLTADELRDQAFLDNYFKGSSSHKMVMVVIPDQLETVRALIPEVYKNRIELIQAEDIRQGFAKAQQLFLGYRIVVNTVQPDARRVTADNKSDEIYEISTEPAALTRLVKKVSLRRALALGGRNLAFAGVFGGALAEQGLAAAGSDYIRFTRANLEALIASISVEVEAARLRERSA